MKKFFKTVKKHINLLLSIGALIVLGIVLIQIVAPLLLVAFSVAPGIGITIVVVICLLLVIVALRRFLRRVRFLRELTALCCEKGYALRKIGHPLLSAFLRLHAGAEIDTGDRTITLYLLACNNRRLPTTLNEDGTVIFHHSFRVRGLRIFGWQHHWRFAAEVVEDSFVLLAPAAYHVWAGDPRRPYAVDNGSRVGPYAVYTCGAFLRDFKRLAEGKLDWHRFGE